jgi:hypothetical protein
LPDTRGQAVSTTPATSFVGLPDSWLSLHSPHAVTAWLDWQLKGDAKGKAMFGGADCGLCKNPNWWFEAKNVQ